MRRRLGKSRSQLYREALLEYVARRDPGAVTAALDEAVAAAGDDVDAWAREAARAALERSELVVGQGDVVWASLPDPTGSGPGFRRPVVVAQGEDFNASRLATVVVVPLTSNLRWATAPGNVLLPARRTVLPRESVANVSQIAAVNRSILYERAGHLTKTDTDLVLAGIELVLGRS